MRRLFALLIFVCGSGLFGQLTPDLSLALDRVSPDSLRGHLSFIASDLLAGRDTPSRGLDIAAEYIAAQFRRAGLEPGGDDGYFQTAKMVFLEPNLDGFDFSFSHGGRNFAVNTTGMILDTSAALDLKNVTIFKLDLGDESAVEQLTAAQIDGKVVLIEIRRGEMRNYRAALGRLRDAKPAAIISLDRSGPGERSPHAGRL